MNEEHIITRQRDNDTSGSMLHGIDVVTAGRKSMVLDVCSDSVLQILAIMAARATEVITNAVDVHLILKEHDVNMMWMNVE